MPFRSIFPEINRVLHAVENDVRQLQSNVWNSPVVNRNLPSLASLLPVVDRARNQQLTAATDRVNTDSFNWPAVDVREVNNSYILEAELPGVAKEDVSVEVDGDGEMLTLSGQVKEEHTIGQPPALESSESKSIEQGSNSTSKSNPPIEAKDVGKSVGTYWAQERYYGTFRRSFQLPKAIKPEDIHASFRNGLLRVTMTKKDSTSKASSVHRVPIQEEDLKAKM
jgi:HSP20 family molecular chaperone IbpA